MEATEELQQLKIENEQNCIDLNGIYAKPVSSTSFALFTTFGRISKCGYRKSVEFQNVDTENQKNFKIICISIDSKNVIYAPNAIG